MRSINCLLTYLLFYLLVSCQLVLRRNKHRRSMCENGDSDIIDCQL